MGVKAGLTLAAIVAGGIVLVIAPPQGVHSVAADQPKKEAPPPRIDRYGDPLPAGVLVRIASGRFRHNERLRALAVSPDGKRLATGGGHRLSVWDAVTGKLERQFEIASDWGHRVTFSPDGTVLTSVDGYHDLTCRRFDLRTGTELSRFHLDLDADPVLTPDGTRMIVVLERKMARLLDTATGRQTGAFPIEGDGRVAVRPDGKALALSDARGGAVRIYDLPGGQLLAHLLQPGDASVPVAFSPDGRSLVVRSDRGEDRIHIWNLTAGKVRLRLKGSRHHQRVSFSPDGNLLATAGPESPDLILWDPATGEQVRRFPLAPWPEVAEFSPEGKTLFTGARDGTILAWDVASGKLLPTSPDPPRAVRDLRFGPGRRLVGRSDVFRAWDPATGREVRRFAGVPGLCALSPDETLLAGSAEDGTISLLDATTGREVRSWRGHDRTLWTLLFSADGKRLFSTGGWEPRVRAWDVASGRCLAEMGGYRDGIMQLAASPDGNWLTTSGNTAVSASDLRLWDLSTGREVRRFSMHPQMKHHAVFSPDGRWLAAAGGPEGAPGASRNVQVWELTTGKPLRNYSGHKEYVTALAFSADSRTLASGSADRTVRLWDLASGQERALLRGHEGAILSLAFAPDDQLLAAASPDAPAFVWDVAAATRHDLPSRPPGDAQLITLWRDLASDDPATAYRAALALAEAPAQAVPFLRKNLSPVAAPDPARLGLLLADLDSEQFAARDRASAELARLGESAVPALRDALSRGPSPEANRRLKALLANVARLEPAADLLRDLRAVELLEQIGSIEARQLLESLATGVPDARLTQKARAARDRVSRR